MKRSVGTAGISSISIIYAPTYIIWIFTMNPSAVAPGHSNPGKGNGLLINNANYIKTVYHEYGDGQTAGLEDGVLGGWCIGVKKKTRSRCFHYVHTRQA